MLTEADIRIVKFWLDISQGREQDRAAWKRAEKRPLKALKISALDGDAQEEVEGLFQGPGASENAGAHPHCLCALDHRPHRQEEEGQAGDHPPPARTRLAPEKILHEAVAAPDPARYCYSTFEAQAH